MTVTDEDLIAEFDPLDPHWHREFLTGDRYVLAMRSSHGAFLSDHLTPGGATMHHQHTEWMCPGVFEVVVLVDRDTGARFVWDDDGWTPTAVEAEPVVARWQIDLNAVPGQVEFSFGPRPDVPAVSFERFFDFEITRDGVPVLRLEHAKTVTMDGEGIEALSASLTELARRADLAESATAVPASPEDLAVAFEKALARYHIADMLVYDGFGKVVAARSDLVELLVGIAREQLLGIKRDSF